MLRDLSHTDGVGGESRRLSVSLCTRGWASRETTYCQGLLQGLVNLNVSRDYKHCSLKRLMTNFVIQ